MPDESPDPPRHGGRRSSQKSTSSEPSQTTSGRTLTIEELARASGLDVEVIRMLGRLPYRLLSPHPTSGRYRLAQVSWARKLREMHDDRRLTWLEIRAWAEKLQKKRGQ